MESILTSIKKLLGIPKEVDDYDTDVIMHINSAFFTLYRIGVGSEAFVVKDESQVWSDFFGDIKINEAIKTYIYLKVKAVFDPPTSSFVLDSLNKNIAEHEARINMYYDPRTPE